MILVATIRPTNKDWSNFFRMNVFVDGSNEGDWKRNGGGMFVPGQLGDSGHWGYENGTLTFFNAQNGNSFLFFENLHWNFKVLCSQKELTGKGVMVPDIFVPALSSERVIWVMGPGLKIKSPLLNAAERDQETWDTPDLWP